MPFTKTFNPGEILTAGDVNEHLLNGGYQFREQVRFTSSGTFVKADFPWLRAIRVRVQAGGGGGGGAATSSSGQAALGSGGGGGGYAESFITDIAGLPASVTVTRGDGGAGAAAGNNNGATGGTSSFGSLTVATGGLGGFGSGPATTNQRAGRDGGVGTTGDLLIPGGASGQVTFAAAASIFVMQNAGDSFFGAGARGQVDVGDGFVGRAFGGGGGGGTTANSPQRPGGAGANGIVILDLFG